MRATFHQAGGLHVYTLSGDSPMYGRGCALLLNYGHVGRTWTPRDQLPYITPMVFQKFAPERKFLEKHAQNKNYKVKIQKYKVKIQKYKKRQKYKKNTKYKSKTRVQKYKITTNYFKIIKIKEIKVR